MKLGTFTEPSTGFNATPAIGDILYYDASMASWNRLGTGTDGQTCKVGYGDAFTVLQSTFDGLNGATAYTDPIAGAYTFVSTAQLSTAQYKFTTGASLLLNGSTDYVTLPDSDSWYFATGDFTIDFWVRFATLPTPTEIQLILNQGTGAGNPQIQVGVRNDGGTYIWRLYGYTDASNSVDVSQNAAVALAINTWYHIVMVRNGSNFYIFQDGVQCGTTQVSTYSFANCDTTLHIGSDFSGGYYFNGFIDELRISKGIARWTANFVPPTVAYGLQPKWVT